MNKHEFGLLTGKSPTQIRKLCDKGIFTVDGFGSFRASKKGPGRTAPIDIVPYFEGDPVSESQGQTLQELKAQKLTVEIEHLRQRLYERQESIESKYEADIVEKVIGCLQPLKEAFAKCQLNPDQTNLINAALEESLRRLNGSSRP